MEWYTPFLWTANGFLALLWLLADHGWSVLLALALGAAVWYAPQVQRGWTLGAALLGLAAGLLAPFPVALLMTVMAAAGQTAVRLDKLSPQNTHWTMVRGIALYALVGLGFSAYRAFLLPAMSDPALVQGQVYLSAIASIALYLLPLGYLALLAQGLFVHPPVDGRADEVIFRYRSRGKP